MRLGLILCALGLHRDRLERVFAADKSQEAVYGERCARCRRARAHIGGVRRRTPALRTNLNFVDARAWLRRNRAPNVIWWR